MLQQLLANPPTITCSMYGVNEFNDSPEMDDYDPWAHAELLGAEIASNMTLPEPLVAAYSPQMHMIFYRAGLPSDVERCAIAHELVHFEKRDKGKSSREEARADRISTLRLIRPTRVRDSAIDHTDLPALAREFCVTEKTMRLYARMARNGTLPRSSNGPGR